jgi:prevent-host-death family protein
MPNIRPVSDLRNNFAEISKVVHESSEPVFLTKNGYGDMVVLSMEAWEEKQFESEIYDKLLEAETEARLSDKRLSHEEVFSGLRRRIKDRTGNV